jgi:hypothetical protein
LILQKLIPPVTLLLTTLLLAPEVFGHNVSPSNASFIEALDGPAVFPFMYLGAKHMVTGIDHLLYLLGVVFFLVRVKDIVLFVSLFTLGHSMTLIAGVAFAVEANVWLVDAIIGLSIVYKAFENLGGFDAVFGASINPAVAVFGFGLVHGLGLATKLQAMTLSSEGLITNLISFNVGVEIGQLVALFVAVLVLFRLRHRLNYEFEAIQANTLLMTAGFLLAGYQLTGYFLT